MHFRRKKHSSLPDEVKTAVDSREARRYLYISTTYNSHLHEIMGYDYIKQVPEYDLGYDPGDEDLSRIYD